MQKYMNNYNNKNNGYYNNPRPEMLELIPDSAKRILEIGCGNGSFGASIKRNKEVHYTGVDIFPDSIASAAVQLDEAILANIENDELPFELEQFDCLIMNDVLEHLLDPWRALQKLLTLVQPNGHVVASIPNMRHYPVIQDLIINCQWNYIEEGVMDKTHLRFFTHKTIESLFSNNNLKTQVLRGINGGRLPWKFALINKIFSNSIDDMRFRQFAYVGRKI
jgi:2-polyprenyl-3-methyl-5-hydroxy-6-metoxy-1,4-benzoquinol methylase